MGPPKCKTCGKTEWRHICTAMFEKRIEELTLRHNEQVAKRKEYLKLKARERRARQKAAKSA